MKSLLLLAIFTLSVTAQDGAVTWFADFDKAVEAAKSQKKDLLVDFTGSDWCGWCIKLHEEVFDQEAFKKGAPEKYILVALDFPRNEEAKAKVPNPTRNGELQEKYGIRGFPSILLMTSEGSVFGRTGYQPGGPEKYLEHLDTLATAGKKSLATAKELETAALAAKPEHRVSVIEKAITALDAAKAEEPGVDVYAKLAKEGVTLDPENKSGLKMKATKALVKSGQADAELINWGRTLDAKNEHGLIEYALVSDMQNVRDLDGVRAMVKALEDFDALGKIHDKSKIQELYANCAFWNHKHLSNPEAAKKWIKKATDLGDSPQVQKLADMIQKGG